MAEPVPSVERAADRAKPVILLRARVRVAPLPACHLTPARDGENAFARGRRKLSEVTHEITRRADESGRGGERMGWIVARDDDAAAKHDASAVAAGERHAAMQRRVGLGFAQARGIDHLAPDPCEIGFARDRLDDQAGEPVAVIGIFETRIGLDDRRLLQAGRKLACVVEWPPIKKLTGVVAVADQSCAVREKLRDGRRCDRRMEIGDELSRGVIELELALLAELQTAGSDEALRNRAHPKVMALP